MILNRLNLKNYRQHGDLTVEFEGHVIGLIGSNGRGKSHLLDSIQFALSGKVAGQDKSKMLKWGETAGYVELEFTHMGAAGTVYREVHSTKAKFTFKDKTYNGITKVNAAIAELTGMDADICTQAVFVPQKEIDSVLFTTPSVRQVAWQKLCGLSDVTKIHERIGRFISDNPAPANALDLIVDASERIDAHNTAIATLDSELKRMQSDLSGHNIEEITARLDKFRQLSAKSAATIKLNSQLTADKSQLSLLQTELAAVAVPDVPELNTEEVQQQIEAAARAESVDRMIADTQASVDNATSQLAALQQVPEGDIAKLQAESEELASQIGASTGMLSLTRSLQSAIKDIGQASTCPMCTQEISDIAEVSRRLGENAESLTEVITSLTIDQQGKQTKAQQAQRINQTAASIQSLLSQNTAQLDTLRASRPAVSDVSVTALRAKLDEHRIAVQANQAMAEKVRTLNARIGDIETRVASQTEQLTTSISETKSAMTELSIDKPADIAAKEREESEAREAAHLKQIEVEKVRTSLQKEQEFLSNTQNTLNSLETRQQAGFAHREMINTITSVREWFHYTQGPQQVIDSLLSRITAGVNEFLTQFNSEFRVTADPGNMSFRYQYCDGRPMADGFPEVSELSGGEMIVLAVSFRFATYCLFAGRVGLLSLDEPTVYLDKYNVSQFGLMIQKVKEIATRMDLQILISTHEESVMPQMDTVVHLGERTIEE